MSRLMTLLMVLPAVILLAIGAMDVSVGNRVRAAAMSPGSMARWEAQADHLGRGQLLLSPERVAANMRAADAAIRANNEFGVAGAEALRETGMWTAILAGTQVVFVVILIAGSRGTARGARGK